MLKLVRATLAAVDELFKYKLSSFALPDFPGYTTDQWGIKAHNRPWLEEQGRFTAGQKIIEVGGAYSTFPSYLAEKYSLEAWNADDFGMVSDEKIWSRWGDPYQFSKKNPSTKYVFEPFGKFSDQYPDAYFDRIFTVSTLEHIDESKRLLVLRDMHRCLRPKGLELHTIDIAFAPIQVIYRQAIVDNILARIHPLASNEKIKNRTSEIFKWIDLFKRSGVKVSTRLPNPIELLDRRVLVESPDVVYRFYPPNDHPKPYLPSASLLLVIENE